MMMSAKSANGNEMSPSGLQRGHGVVRVLLNRVPMLAHLCMPTTILPSFLPSLVPLLRCIAVAAHTAAAGTDALAGIKSWQLRREAAKQHLAMAAHQLLQDPNKQVAQLRNLLELLQDEDAQVSPRLACACSACIALLRSPASVCLYGAIAVRACWQGVVDSCHCWLPQVCRLAMLTLLAVFKDLVPAYRIRPTSAEEEPMEKASIEGCRHVILIGMVMLQARRKAQHVALRGAIHGDCDNLALTVALHTACAVLQRSAGDADI